MNNTKLGEWRCSDAKGEEATCACRACCTGPPRDQGGEAVFCRPHEEPQHGSSRRGPGDRGVWHHRQAPRGRAAAPPDPGQERAGLASGHADQARPGGPERGGRQGCDTGRRAWQGRRRRRRGCCPASRCLLASHRLTQAGTSSAFPGPVPSLLPSLSVNFGAAQRWNSKSGPACRHAPNSAASPGPCCRSRLTCWTGRPWRRGCGMQAWPAMPP